MKRASEVPPPVENSGRRPVTLAMASPSVSTSPLSGDRNERDGAPARAKVTLAPAQRAAVKGAAGKTSGNVVRVISLFYLGRYDRDVFEWAHLYVWQALIMLDVLIVWVVWVRLVPGDREPSPPLAAA